MARKRMTLAEAAQQELNREREQAERDKRWDEHMHSNERPLPTVATPGARPTLAEADAARSAMGQRLAARADAIAAPAPTDGEEIEDQALTEQGEGPAPTAGAPEISRYSILVTHLEAARALLWARLNEGHWEHEETIAALLESYHRLGTMLQRLSDAMLQLPLPVPPEE